MKLIFAQVGVERLDWFGFGVASANRTAAFIACLIVVSWIFAAIFKKTGFWISIILSLVLYYFLVQTQSRGAFVALIVSMAIFFSFAKIEYNKLRTFALLATVVVAGFMYLNSPISTRMGNMLALQSSSANCRADIYLSGIKMLTDAPNGVMVEKSPSEIYMHWYQNPDDSESYISMINSHLEFMCRYGFFIRFTYIVLWVFIFCITFPIKRNAINATAFAIWICFFICASFSNVANFWVLWVIPLAIFVFAIKHNRERLLSAKFYAAALLLSAFPISALYTFSYTLPRNCKLRFLSNGDIVCGNSQCIKYLLFSPSEKTIGTRFGSELVQFCKENGAGVLITSVPPTGGFKCAIICDAKNVSELSGIKAKRMVLLNAQFDYSFSKFKDGNISIYLGGFSDWRNRKAWENIARDNRRIKTVILEDAAYYIPNWTRFFTYEND